VFVLVPVVLGGLVPFLKKDAVSGNWQLVVLAAAAICALLADLATAIYKALDLDVVSKHAGQFKVASARRGG
jgi:hypothetical protein